MLFMQKLWVNSDKSNKTTRIKILLQSTKNFKKNWLLYMHFRLTVSNENKKNYNQDILHFENAIYRVLHQRTNKTASFAEHLKFQEYMTFIHTLWVNSGKSKIKKLKSGHYTFWKYYKQGAPRNSENKCLLCIHFV